MATTDAHRVAQARRWFRRVGYDAVDADGAKVVSTPEHPSTWEANWVMAAPGAGPAAVLSALDRHFADGWQVVHVDVLTDPAVEAALALAGFSAEGALIEMVARDVTPTRPVPALEYDAIGPGEWPRFARLAAIDAAEGGRSSDVAAGLLDAKGRRLAGCQLWLLKEEGEDIGFGFTAACPNGLGLIEHLFTLPSHRGRGVMSGFIAEATRRLRGGGCDAVFLDAHAHDTPKRLYARLGFAPVALTRTWVRAGVRQAG